MTSIATLLVFGGLLVTLVGGFIFLLAAFRENVIWGLGCLLVSPVSLFFLILHWDRAKAGFFIELQGLAIILVGVLLGGHLF